MEIIIKIPEEQYDAILFASQNRKPIKKPRSASDICFMAVVNGKPLPKGHGRLIDVDKQDDTITRLNENGWGITRSEYKLIDRVVFEIPTVIEAEGGSK